MDENKLGTSVNLLRARVRFQKRKRSKYTQIQSIAMVVLAAYGGLILLVIGANAALQFEANRVENSIGNETSLIESMAEKEYRHNLLISRADFLSEVFDRKGNEREIMMAIYDNLPEGTVVDQFVTGEGMSNIELRGTTREVFSFRRYIAFVERSVESRDFSRITLSDLGRGLDAKYAFQAVFSIGGTSGSGGGDEEEI